MKKIITASLLFLLMGGLQVHAVEIDLSQFASGDAATHSHVWVDMYDTSSHWQECSLCGAERDKSEHLLSISYTISETS